MYARTRHCEHAHLRVRKAIDNYTQELASPPIQCKGFNLAVGAARVACFLCHAYASRPQVNVRILRHAVVEILPALSLAQGHPRQEVGLGLVDAPEEAQQLPAREQRLAPAP